MVCTQYLTIEQIRDMDTGQLIDAYRQGYILKDLASSCVSSITTRQTIDINAAPIGGTAPYSVSFYKKLNMSDPVQIGITQIGVAEAINSTTPSTATVPYTISSADIIAALGDFGTTPVLAPGYIRIITNITDSCPISSGGSKTCSELCDIRIICASPICDLIVT